MIKKVTQLICLLIGVHSYLLAQQTTVSGKVTGSDDGQPIPGVNIIEKGTARGTSADVDGNYSIEVDANATLVFSSIGFTTQEVTVSGRTMVNVVLVSDNKTLNEVVVVGYGEVKKKDATGAVAVIGTQDFNKGVLTNPQDLILGKFSGVSVTSASGSPTSGSTIRIRGGSSLNASNDPLIVVDGFPVDNNVGNGSSNSGFGVTNILSNLNPNDIESFTVLKDASATAIYGSRAANGVIIITTKKGNANQKMTYGANLTTSVGTPMKYLDVMTGDEFRALANKMAQTGQSGINAAAIAKLGTANTDWQRAIYRNAVSQDYNVNASGAVKGIPVRASYGYTNQQGILLNTGVSRHSLNLNVTPTFLDGDLKVTVSAKGNLSNNNFGETGAVGSAIEFDPTQPIYDASKPEYGGYFSWLKYNAVNSTANPVAQCEQTNNKADIKRLIGNIQAEYKLPFAKDIKVTLSLGTDRTRSDGYNRVPLTGAFIQNQGTRTGKDDSYWSSNKSDLLDLYANYTKTFDIHKIDFTAGYGWQHFYREGNTTNSNTARTINIPFKNQNYLVSFYGRLNYTLNGKYLITATLRNDGSSRFGPGNKWGLFPSIAGAWRMKDESFLSDVKALSELKLRVGYGITGQQDIQGKYFPYLATYQISDVQSQYQLGNQFYYTYRPNAYDPNIKWETTATTNVGVDFGLWKDRLTGTVEVFYKKTSDLLNEVNIANGSNFSNKLTTNVGTFENKGLEISLKGVVMETDDINWQVGANFTAINSKITKLTFTDDPTYVGVPVGGVGVNANIQIHSVDYPAYSFFVLQQVYDANGKPMEGVYVDRSGKGGSIVTDANKYHYKRPVPDALIGINSRFSYKKFDCSFSGRFSIGNYVYNNVQASRAYYNNTYYNEIFHNNLRSLYDTNFTTQQLYSDYYVQNASYFKMDNMSAGYTFDNVMKTKMKVRASLTVQNAFFITKYKGIDPEVDGGNIGIDNNIYPRPRTVLLGLNVTF